VLLKFPSVAGRASPGLPVNLSREQNTVANSLHIPSEFFLPNLTADEGKEQSQVPPIGDDVKGIEIKFRLGDRQCAKERLSRTVWKRTVGRQPPRAGRTGSGGGDQTAGEPVGAANVSVLLSQRVVAVQYPPGTTMVSDWLVVGSRLYDVKDTGSS
jgi:hypothetical protein